ncbi:MAG: hypothetical protein NVS1B4_00900 [Gemmatimonadaceae bacterium]
MTTVLLIGPDAALLEGLSQTLGAVGHRTRIAATVAEAMLEPRVERPLIAVIERSLAAGGGSATGGDAMNIPLAPGGALVTYRTRTEDPLPLPSNVQRGVLADLTLPLERHRLIALVHSVAGRALATGRGPVHTPPDRQRSYQDGEGTDPDGGEGRDARMR